MSADDERRASFKRYKEDVEREGKPFFPYAMFHDTVMSLVVVAVIIALACIWYFTADGTTPGEIGPWYSDEADPGTTNFIPRPDWYFYFLFYLLRIFKWPETVILGTVGIPTLLMVLLFAVPFIDRRQERRLSRRPVAVIAAVLTAVSMGVLTYKGATAQASRSAARRSQRSTAGRNSKAASRRKPAAARRSSRRSAASSATSTSARGPRTPAHPSSRTSARRARASTTSTATSRTRRSSGTT